MEWKIESAQVWLASTEIVWTREVDGINQRLWLAVENDKNMFARATEWVSGYKERAYTLDKIGRRHVINQSEISALWNEVYFNGTDE